MHHVNVVKLLVVTKIGLGDWRILKECYPCNLVDAICNHLLQWNSTLKNTIWYNGFTW